MNKQFKQIKPIEMNYIHDLNNKWIQKKKRKKDQYRKKHSESNWIERLRTREKHTHLHINKWNEKNYVIIKRFRWYKHTHTHIKSIIKFK